MIYEIDNALRELLIREMPMKKGEVDIAFEQPKRDWSARLNKPTLNFFLFDLRENVELRGSEQWIRQDNPDGTVTLKRNPVRMDLQYLVTSWAREIQDEHRLLSAALTALLRLPVIPEDLLPDELTDQPAPIRLSVAQGNGLSNPFGTVELAGQRPAPRNPINGNLSRWIPTNRLLSQQCAQPRCGFFRIPIQMSFEASCRSLSGASCDSLRFTDSFSGEWASYQQ